MATSFNFYTNWFQGWNLSHPAAMQSNRFPSLSRISLNMSPKPSCSHPFLWYWKLSIVETHKYIIVRPIAVNPSLLRRDSSRKEFTLKQMSTDSVNWHCLRRVRRVCSSARGGNCEVMFVSVSLRDKPVIRPLMNLSHCTSVFFLFLPGETGPNYAGYCNPVVTERQQHRKLSLMLYLDCRWRL